ncbi:MULTISPECIES: glycosyltransferase family 2 protein [Arthrobacter]|uniref:Glycosyltransferase n=1 Tax=Arthrobacter sunyaminii TaxID=2816859 RepID=A0A975S484_9MICC|nr:MULTISPECIES: glycosyltransferase family 2 protein [Arthrobacter]MBO0909082.1 glycosyltransferase family 2 protein [Arthrobacter sunyaminii]QWQ35425.1 glycosyltransferase [Arthrobacter sunyaminii]
MPAVDILLPYYGDVDLMKAAVGSVFAQTREDWLLTVLDDAYPDPEPQRWFASLEDPRVTYLRNETNLGANGNYRKALDMAQAPVVVIMGADDVMLPSYLEHVTALLDEYPEASVAQPGVEIIDGTGHRAKTLTDSVKSLTAPSGPYPALVGGERMAASLLRAGWHYFPALAWRREAIAHFGFRPEFDVVQDLALLMDIAAAGGSIVVDGPVSFQYRRHASSDSSVRAADGRRFDEERRYFREQTNRFRDLGWPRAERAARFHWTSRLNALTVLLASLRHPSVRTAQNMTRHIVG